MRKLFSGHKEFFSLFLLIAACFFLSCTQNLPEIRYSNMTVIFDYLDNDSLPDSRLSVFVESISDVRRYENINVVNNQNGFTWDVSQLVRVRSAEKMYAGNTNLKVPSGEKIPDGEYRIVYSNADLEQIASKFKLEYDSVFYETKASDIPDLMLQKKGIKYISIYDKSDKMIYYGERNSQLSDNRKIWNRYSNASYFHEIWILPDKSVICVMPKQLVVPS